MSDSFIKLRGYWFANVGRRNGDLRIRGCCAFPLDSRMVGHEGRGNGGDGMGHDRMCAGDPLVFNLGRAEQL